MKVDDVTCPQCGSADWEETDFDWDGSTGVIYAACSNCGCQFRITFEADVVDVEIDEYGDAMEEVDS